jgi:hypothetical protein
MEEVIVNRVSKSPLITIDLEQHLIDNPTEVFDFEKVLFQGMILKEKDFRDYVKSEDWTVFEGKLVLITCSADAIIPSWAYMLLVSKIQPYAKDIVVGDTTDAEKWKIDQAIQGIDLEEYRDKKVVIKGCGNIQSRDYAYVEASKKLLPVVASLMYGEPCSTVPVYKNPRQKNKA